MAARDAKPREVFCVTCGAFAHAPCLTSNGNKVHGSHAARVDFAAQHIVTEVAGALVIKRVSQPIGHGGGLGGADEGERSRHFRGV